MATTQSTTQEGKKHGPLPTPGRVRVTLYLDETVAEWGKQQEGGLSELVRNLLAHQKESIAIEQAGDYPILLRENYQTLITKKLQIGLTKEEDRELESIRQQINAIDRTTKTWQYGEQAAQQINNQLESLRQEIEALPLKKKE
jgi:hypothetical protein